MIALRLLRPGDIPLIKAWPPYPPEFGMLDYSLRDGGWLDEYGQKEGTDILVAEVGHTIAGFSILSKKADHRAEFRIALHPHSLGQGLGRAIALLTLDYGFSDPALDTISLIVRKNNPRAERLYASLKFHACGECTELVHGELVAFRQMEIDRSTFEGVKRND